MPVGTLNCTWPSPSQQPEGPIYVGVIGLGSPPRKTCAFSFDCRLSAPVGALVSSHGTAPTPVTHTTTVSFGAAELFAVTSILPTVEPFAGSVTTAGPCPFCAVVKMPIPFGTTVMGAGALVWPL